MLVFILVYILWAFIMWVFIYFLWIFIIKSKGLWYIQCE